jgi:hypothetical protein
MVCTNFMHELHEMHETVECRPRSCRFTAAHQPPNAASVRLTVDPPTRHSKSCRSLTARERATMDSSRVGLRNSRLVALLPGTMYSTCLLPASSIHRSSKRSTVGYRQMNIASECSLTTALRQLTVITLQHLPHFTPPVLDGNLGFDGLQLPNVPTCLQWLMICETALASFPIRGQAELGIT